jgi:hypothetical protein
LGKAGPELAKADPLLAKAGRELSKADSVFSAAGGKFISGKGGIFTASWPLVILWT